MTDNEIRIISRKKKELFEKANPIAILKLLLEKATEEDVKKNPEAAKEKIKSFEAMQQMKMLDDLMEELGYSDGYIYPHDRPGHFAVQQYLPDALQKQRLWYAADNAAEHKVAQRMEQLWGKSFTAARISSCPPASDPCTISGFPPPFPWKRPFKALHRGRVSSVRLPKI